MAFFPRTAYNADASFHPLFRLLDDFDKYSKGGNDHSDRRSHAIQWQPKFDVRETSDAYHLHGEIPGVSKDNISIEFPEHQNVVVSGKAERTYTTGTSPDAAAEETSSRRNSHQATVEDEADAESKANGGEVIEEKEPADKAKYWLSERSIGEFSRTFTFPSRIDEEGVSASLQDGILNVTIPKAKKHETRRIVVN